MPKVNRGNPNATKSVGRYLAAPLIAPRSSRHEVPASFVAAPSRTIARAVAFALITGATPLWAGPAGEQVVQGLGSVSV